MCSSGDGDGRVDGLHGVSGAVLVRGDVSPPAAHAAAAGGDAPHPQAGLVGGPRRLLVETMGPPAIKRSRQTKAVTSDYLGGNAANNSWWNYYLAGRKSIQQL